MSRTFRANAMLLVTALIWGVAFVAQDVAMDYMPPFTFIWARMLLAGLALIPCIYFLDKRAKKDKATKSVLEGAPSRKTLLVGGCLCGLMLFLGSSLQQLGIAQTSAGKAGFVTALYIVMVPLAGLLVGKRVRGLVWAGVGLCTVGLFLLCVTQSLTISQGDVFLFLCALAFTGHILVIDRFSAKVDCVQMSCIQFFVASGLGLVCMGIFEQPTWEGIVKGAVPILYAGVMSGAVGYTLQIVAQKETDPAIASLLLCFESVFAVLAGWAILGDALSPRELAGCGLMLAGILLAQWPVKAARARIPFVHK